MPKLLLKQVLEYAYQIDLADLMKRRRTSSTYLLSGSLDLYYRAVE